MSGQYFTVAVEWTDSDDPRDEDYDPDDSHNDDDDDEQLRSDSDDDERERHGRNVMSGRNDDSDEEVDDDDDDEEDEMEWEPEDEHDELSSETEAELRSLLQHALPEVTRASIERIFGDEAYFPMMFARSEHEQQQQRAIVDERIAHQLRGYSDDRVACKSDSKTVLPSATAKHYALHYDRTRKKRMFHTLCVREQVGRTSSTQSIQLQETFMPFQQHKHCRVVDYVRDRLYCGGFNSSGSLFLAAGQRGEIQLYDTVTWQHAHALPVRDVRWTVTDALFTPDDRSVLYASINSNVRVVSVDYARDGREAVCSLAKPMRRGLNSSRNDNVYSSRFGVWCMDVNATGTEFVAGTSTNSVVLYDLAAMTPLSHVEGHDDDVNAIAFVDGALHTNVFVSGSDDQLIKLWDRRVLSETHPMPQGVFAGHTDGITHIASRDDGYYFVSNAKDQSCKLWDIRKCVGADAHAKLPTYRKPYSWDYRYQSYPGRNRLPVTHPHDASVMTYRGHLVMETLIRCHFSPMHTTAQKYVYTGSADGRVYIYDVVTGDLVEVFSMKPNGLTRDVRWHPFEPTIVSPDFYGKLCIWQRSEAHSASA